MDEGGQPRNSSGEQRASGGGSGENLEGEHVAELLGPEDTPLSLPPSYVSSSSGESSRSGLSSGGLSHNNSSSLRSEPREGFDHEDAVKKFRHRSKSMTGETIYKDHPSHDIMLDIKLGVRHSVGKHEVNERSELLLQDFQADQKTFFPAAGSNDTPPHKSSDFRFKEYAPLAFRRIRERFSIDEADFMLSIGGEAALREVPTPGKSGALFYKTKDDRFLLKTISRKESKNFRNILAQYYNHVMMHKDTLLPRFFQLFRIQTSRGRFIRMVVMHNILPTHLLIKERYDLKGSTFGRRTDKQERARSNITLKDLDFVELGRKLVLGVDKKQLLVRQLQGDVEFLQQNNLMDYSLLLGVKVVDEDVLEERSRREGEAKAHHQGSGGSGGRSGLYDFDGAIKCTNEDDCPVLVYCGIIDILQEYDRKKQVENLWKGARFDRHTISAVAPRQYGSRFVDFLKSHVFF